MFAKNESNKTISAATSSNHKAKKKFKELAEQSLNKSLNKRKSTDIFTFNKMVKTFHQVLNTFPDTRTGTNTSVEIRDAALGAFSLFFMQNPSFLDYQKSMQKTKGKNNAQSLFGIYKILSDNHIRQLLDHVHPSYLFSMFSYILDGLDSTGYIDEFRSYNHNLLIALDGTQYHSSQAIHCDNCSQTHHHNRSVTYSHSVLTPVIVKPGNNRVIALIPEFITPQDGHQKQDCENNAAKRWIRTFGPKLRELRTTLTADDLYCKQPLCQLMRDEGLDFILVCKEDSHKTLYEYLDYLKEDIRTVEKRQWVAKRNKRDTYRFLNGLPLRDSEDALEVNWCELISTIENEHPEGKNEDKVIYKNAFVTNFEITEKNVEEIVADGRGRWKVENENNNVLKTRGYHLEHNFGHGKKNLSALLLTLNILAFLVHTVLDMMDENYQFLRRVLPSRMTFFSDLRALTRYIYFESWDQLIYFMLRGLEQKVTLSEPEQSGL